MKYLVILIIFSNLLVLCKGQDAFPVDTNSVPIHFYKFGPDFGDSVAPVNDDGSTGLIQIGIAFPFYDHGHDHLFVSIINYAVLQHASLAGGVFGIYTITKYDPSHLYPELATGVIYIVFSHCFF